MHRPIIGILLLAAGLVAAIAETPMTPRAISPSATMAPAALPAGAEARQARLLAKFGPQTRAWINQEARREVTSGIVSESAATGAARNDLAQLGGMNNGDISALAFLVLMDAARQSDQDLKDAMAGSQQTDNQKKALRAQASQSKDSLGDMSQEQSLRLQTAMDRRSRAMQALSNVMKKASATDDGIISNMK